MKKIFFVICSCLSFAVQIQMYAQKTEYHSVFGETNTYFNVLYSYHANPETPVSITDATFSFNFISDTVINGIAYKEFEVWVPASCGPFSRYFLRESEDKSKLYCFGYSGEVLLMDLNLNLHDTFKYENYELTVENILYEEENIKHILFAPIKHIFNGDDTDYQFEFVEGIGSTAIFGLESRIGLLLCAYKDDIKVFSNNSDFLPIYIRGKCTYEHWFMGIEDIPRINENLKIYPNPAHNFIEIDLGKNFMNYRQIILYDLLGKPCLRSTITQKKQHLDIQNLSVGTYIIEASGQGLPSVYGKFAIIR